MAFDMDVDVVGAFATGVAVVVPLLDDFDGFSEGGVTVGDGVAEDGADGQESREKGCQKYNKRYANHSQSRPSNR